MAYTINPSVSAVWASDAFLIGGLGQVSVTGTFSVGTVRSAPGTCRFRGEALEFHGYCRFGPDRDFDLLEMSAGGGVTSLRLEDDEFDELREIVSEGVAEWYAAEGHVIIAANSRADRMKADSSAASRRSLAAARREALLLELAAPEHVAHMERVIRDLAEIETELSLIPGTPAPAVTKTRKNRKA